MEPLIEALPAEEVTTFGDNRFLSHVEANVALKVCSTAAPQVFGILVTTGRSHCPGGGRRLVGGCSRMSHLRMAGGGGEGLLFGTDRGRGVAMRCVDRAVAIVRLRGRPSPRPLPSPPAAAAGAAGVAGIAAVREASPSSSSPSSSARADARARGADPARHESESNVIDEEGLWPLGKEETRFVKFNLRAYTSIYMFSSRVKGEEEGLGLAN